MGWIGAAAGAASSIFGSLGKNKMLRRLESSIKQQQCENENWYNRRYNEDATQRADALRMAANAEESIRNRNKGAAGSAAIMGGTEQSVAATKAANANTMADMASQIAVAGQQRKDNVEQQYMAKRDALQDKLDNLQSQKQSIFDIAGNAIGGAADGARNPLF
jgi:hypothetical protein